MGSTRDERNKRIRDALETAYNELESSYLEQIAKQGAAASTTADALDHVGQAARALELPGPWEEPLDEASDASELG